MENRLNAAYTLGRRHKETGRMRVSPFYEDPQADQYFFAGWDNKPISEVGNEEREAPRDAGRA